jgi:pyrimidine oxygenase
MMRAYGFLDNEIGKENAFVAKSRSTFMTPVVLGTPATVVEQLTEMLEVSQTDGLMLIFPDYLKGIPIFGKEVLPALRERFPTRVLAPVHG